MKTMKTSTCLLMPAIIAIVGVVFCPPSADGQFGKNKVQYRTFDWRYIQTDHFDIYFYDSAGANLARFTAHVAEEMLLQVEEAWRYRLTDRVPFVVYNSKNDFQQTNVVGEYMPEGVGGVTELFKNRVAIPFEGEWDKFRHVIRHELVHAILNDKFYGGTFQSLISNNIRFILPTWMNEGLAEFEARGGYDVETDMFMRDAVLGEYMPGLERLNGYFAYRGGQAFYWYVEQTYGREKIGELLNRCKATGDLDLAFRGAFGKTLEEFSDQWTYELKKLYYPDIAERRRGVDMALRLTDHRRDESFFNTSPSLSPDGNRLAWISDRTAYRSVYVMDVATPSQARRIVEGEENADFEELHLLSPSIAWSPDGQRIALAVKSEGRDVIYLIDVDEGDREKIEIDMDAIYSVDWSPDGTRLAFQGIRGDHSDIYVYDLQSGDLINATEDVFSDVEPVWGPDSRTIYFLSDRQDHPARRVRSSDIRIWNYNYLERDLYSLDIESGEFRRLTKTEGVRESSPTPIGGGRLLYVSDASGIANLYELDLATLNARPLTNSISGIEHVTVARDGSLAAFTAWNGDGQDVFLLRSPTALRIEGDTLEPTRFVQRSANAPAMVDSLVAHPTCRVTTATAMRGFGSVRLAPDDSPLSNGSADPGTVAATGLPSDPRLISGEFAINDYTIWISTDVIQATGAYTSFYGLQGVTQMLFSDMLGDHQIYLSSSLLLDLKNSDFLASYAYLAERVDYAVDAFHSSRFLGLYDRDGAYVLTRFRQYGVTGRASNPFDRFRRMDLGLSFLRAAREPVDQGRIEEQGKMLLVPSIGYVFDNSRDWAFNPVSGSRYYVTLVASPRLGEDGVGFYSILADARHYLPLSRFGDYSLGLRLSGGASFGAKPQKFFIGGVENWLNYVIGQETLPITEAEDFIFATPGYPLRGFSYNQEAGSKYALANMELRFPLFRAIVSGPVPVLFQYVSGVAFVDAGTAWNDQLNLLRTTPSGATVTDDLLLGTGLGGRAYVLGIPLRLDIAWSYDLDGWSAPNYYFSMGYDF